MIARQPDLKDLIPLTEAAPLMRRTESSARKLARSGLLKAHQDEAGRWWTTKAAVRAFMFARKETQDAK